MKSEVAKWIDSWPLWEKRNKTMTRGERYFWRCMARVDSVNPNQWNLLDQASRDRWTTLALKAYSKMGDSREQREREKRATVRVSEEPAKGDET